MNAIDDSGILAIAARLQRLSDLLRKDGFLIFKINGVDFEPKWFPLIYSLSRKPVMSVVELATEIGYSHPSTITLLKELQEKKLIISKKDKSDERKRMLQLSEKGKQLIEKMKPVWKIIAAATRELTNTKNNLMKAIEETEARFIEKSLLQRARDQMMPKKKKAGIGAPGKD
jgi:DNA-binding MarR family transcriptional regulator